MKTTLLALSLWPLLLIQDSRTVSLTYQDGERINAQVLELKGDDVRLRVFVLGGHMQIRRKLADFQPGSVFVIEREASHAEGFDGHFALARRAAELGLVAQAGQEARLAIDSIADPAEAAAKRSEVRGWAAGALETMVETAVKDGRLKDAQHCLKLLSTRLPDMRTEDQLATLADKVEALETRDREGKEAARQARLDAKVREEIDRKLKPIQRRIEEGDKSQREAVRKSRSTVASRTLVEKAIDQYRAAWKSLQELVEKHPDDAELARAAESMGKHLHDNAIRAALHAANVLTVQSDYKSAMDWANRVLAFDPDNAEAKEMVRTIQIAQAAASSQWGWGWHVVGGPDQRPGRE